MILFLLKGILIGLIFGVPVGSVGVLTVQRTLNSGIKSGIFTGLGSSVADCLYACIGAFGFTLVSDFFLEYENIITTLGGAIVVALGIRLIVNKKENNQQENGENSFWKMFLSSFMVGITNPAAILTFLFAFSYFGITGESGIGESILLVCGIFVGTFFWWLILSFVASKFKNKTSQFSFTKMNKVFGSCLCLFGGIIFFQAIL